MSDVRSEQDLPQTIPVFPLPAVLLLPGTKLPLNIFEPRYLDMVSDAMAGNRIIGMVQPLDPQMAAAVPEIYQIGGAGKITAYRETEDDRYLITLTGLCRFHIAEELAVTTRYRQVRAEWQRFRADLAPVDDDPDTDVREALIEALRSYLEISQFQVDWQAVQNAPTGSLVDNLSLVCPFSPSEKQALLEARDHSARCTFLTALLDMAVVEREGGGSGDDDSGRPLH
jgi:Lon protease-like protein